ncbi:MAG: DUF502 domain-containing protein [Gemmatimonadota bacterium]|nr:DUF502 domain-containing protein [Gemmatimonadota bacterium]
MKEPRSATANLRRYLLQGLAVTGPLGITAFILWWLFVQLDGVLGRWLDPLLGWSAPGIGLLLLILLLLLVGWLVERALGGRLLRLGERLLNRVPLVRRLYGGSSRIVKAVIGEEKMAFREVVLFEYPMEGTWAYGLVTGPAPTSAAEALGGEGVTVYLPTAPNPMSGFLIVVPREKALKTALTPEEVFTYILSAGSVSPGRAAQLLDSRDVVAVGETGAADVAPPSHAG